MRITDTGTSPPRLSRIGRRKLSLKPARTHQPKNRNDAEREPERELVGDRTQQDQAGADLDHAEQERDQASGRPRPGCPPRPGRCRPGVDWISAVPRTPRATLRMVRSARSTRSAPRGTHQPRRHGLGQPLGRRAVRQQHAGDDDRGQEAEHAEAGAGDERQQPDAHRPAAAARCCARAVPRLASRQLPELVDRLRRSPASRRASRRRRDRQPPPTVRRRRARPRRRPGRATSMASGTISTSSRMVRPGSRRGRRARRAGGAAWRSRDSTATAMTIPQTIGTRNGSAIEKHQKTSSSSRPTRMTTSARGARDREIAALPARLRHQARPRRFAAGCVHRAAKTVPWSSGPLRAHVVPGGA